MKLRILLLFLGLTTAVYSRAVEDNAHYKEENDDHIETDLCFLLKHLGVKFRHGKGQRIIIDESDPWINGKNENVHYGARDRWPDPDETDLCYLLRTIGIKFRHGEGQKTIIDETDPWTTRAVEENVHYGAREQWPDPDETDLCFLLKHLGVKFRHGKGQRIIIDERNPWIDGRNENIHYGARERWPDPDETDLCYLLRTIGIKFRHGEGQKTIIDETDPWTTRAVGRN